MLTGRASRDPCKRSVRASCVLHNTKLSRMRAKLFARCASLLLRCPQAPLTRQHYTVDMFLAVVVGCLVWHAATRWTYNGEPVRWRHPGEAPDPRQKVLTALILGVLGIVGYIIIVGGA